MPALISPTLSEQKSFWNQWNASLRDPGNLNEWSIRRGDAIIEIVRSLNVKQGNILDFGCGTGWLTERLTEFGEVTGVDLAERVIAAAQSRAPHIKFIAGDLFQIPLPRADYDIVVSQEVIAHVPDQAAYIDRAADLLKTGGYLIVTTPNKFVMDRGDWPPQPPSHIELWFTMARLKRCLRRRFRIIRTTTITPLGNRGILQLVNSQKLNTFLKLFISEQKVARAKEWVGLGYNLIAVAAKR